MSAQSQDIASWAPLSYCKDTDPEAFHPVRSPQQVVRKICRSCPVRQLCLDYSIENGMLGVWGGMTESERRRYASENGMVFGSPPTFDDLGLPA